MIHNGFSWDCNDSNYYMTMDAKGNNPIGIVSLIQVGSSWKGTISLGKDCPWYKVELVLPSLDVAITTLETMYNFLEHYATSPVLWESTDDKTMVRETECCKGILVHHPKRWDFTFQDAKHTTEPISVKTKDEALLLANVTINAYVDSYRREHA